MTEQNNLGEIITWCQNWLIVTNRATNAKDFEILGRAIVWCSAIYINEDGHICNPYGSGKRMTNTDWRANELINKAIKEYLMK